MIEIDLLLLKWIITFFTISLSKEYVLRIMDFLMISDFSGVAIICVAILA